MDWKKYTGIIITFAVGSSLAIMSYLNPVYGISSLLLAFGWIYSILLYNQAVSLGKFMTTMYWLSICLGVFFALTKIAGI